MYSLMERAGQLNPGHWQLLRVAVVALENDIFVGRLFFGDAATGTVMWDCDCRPSDGVYLSLRTQCPFFVARKVWEQAAVPIRESKVHLIAMHEAELAAVQQQQQQHPHPHAGHHQAQPHQGGASGSATTASMDTGGGRGGPTQVPDSSSSGGGGDASTSSPFEYTGIRPNDPDVIVLLKRELAIAVSEEDYAAAIRLRDHPYMQLYRRIEAFQQLGRANEAAALQRELASMITRNSDDAADAM
ncbi:hypothetical protein PLESTM_000801400 [Pleodorina starrii]|nr:hypothetical protein PLESTM_000801400 [Pleodorina starrii]